MGTVKMLSILLCLPALLTAETIHRSLQVEEGGTSYTQTITFDFDNRLQIIDVPAHHNIVHSRSHFYFNQGKVVESHPNRGNCYVKPLPVGIAPMEKLASVLGKRKASPIQAKEQSVVHRSFATSRRIPLSEISDLPEAYTECKSSRAYAVEQIPSTFHSNKTVTHASADTMEEVQGSLRSGSCAFPADCLWQTCWVGDDSCFWTVNCPANDNECDDMIHNSDFHVNDDPITCKACFNTACPGCEESWEKAGIVGESVVNGPVTRSLQMPSSSVPRTTSRMGTSSPATCVLQRAATADLEEPSCARRTPPGTKAQCGVLSSECLEQ